MTTTRSSIASRSHNGKLTPHIRQLLTRPLPNRPHLAELDMINGTSSMAQALGHGDEFFAQAMSNPTHPPTHSTFYATLCFSFSIDCQQGNTHLESLGPEDLICPQLVIDRWEMPSPFQDLRHLSLNCFDPVQNRHCETPQWLNTSCLWRNH